MSRSYHLSAAAALLGFIAVTLIVLALVVQTARIEGFKFWPFSVTGYKEENRDLRRQLREISEPRNEQKKVSERNVERVVKGNPEIRTITRVIREAPNPEQCKTPGLSTLREVL